MLRHFNQAFQPAVEVEMRRVVSSPLFRSSPDLEAMLRYHLGWEDQIGQGKRIRPLLVLLTTGAVGADWSCALPSAAAVELLHNFSLIHDDIEDGSPLRRGRESVWKKWGVPLAINAGDAMFTLAFSALTRLSETVNPQAALRSFDVLAETSLRLTCGQHLDIANEEKKTIGIDDYWAMAAGKTAALLSTCARLGAIAGQASSEQEECLSQFGQQLGLAFQAWDDWLGIWGDPAEIGKSTESDLVAGKKTLPVVYALQQGGRFAERWNLGRIHPEEVEELASWLDETGAREYTELQVNQLTIQAIDSLHAAVSVNDFVQCLEELALSLIKRSK